MQSVIDLTHFWSILRTKNMFEQATCFFKLFAYTPAAVDLLRLNLHLKRLFVVVSIAGY